MSCRRAARRVERAWPRPGRPTVPRPGRSRPSRGSTGSATPAAGSSTSARPRTCAPGCRRTSRTSATCTRAPRTMVTTARERRVDGRQHRGRGAAAGVLLDQGVRPALQRQVPRRQVLPLAGGHRRRGVPAGDGRARRQEAGHPLLRPLLPRLGDPRDRRPAAAGVPDALVQQRRVQAVRADRPALPARLHRQVRRRRASATGDRRGAPRDRRRLLRLHGRQHRRPSSSASRGRCTPPPRPGLRAGRPAARRPRRAQQGAGEAGRGAPRRHRRRRHRARRGPARGRRADLLRARRPDPRPARLGGRQGRRRRRPPSWCERFLSSSTAARPTTRSRARCWCRRCPPDADVSRSCSSDLRGSRVRDPGAAARRQEGAAGDGGAQRRARRWPCTRPSGPAT